VQHSPAAAYPCRRTKQPIDSKEDIVTLRETPNSLDIDFITGSLSFRRVVHQKTKAFRWKERVIEVHRFKLIFIPFLKSNVSIRRTSLTFLLDDFPSLYAQQNVVTYLTLSATSTTLAVNPKQSLYPPRKSVGPSL
jgi:hypothetical protein